LAKRDEGHLWNVTPCERVYLAFAFHEWRNLCEN
jgi:hypothetical protein